MFAGIAKALPEADILVVDDNSPDGTGKLVAELAQSNRRIHLLSRAGKQGLGTATRAGLEWAIQHNYDFVINLDADHSHDPARLPALLDVCLESPIDVSVGSRYVDGGGFEGLAWHRKLISRGLNTYAKRLLNLPIKDCSGSYRCYRISALRKLDFSKLTCKGYGFLEEILVALKRSGATFAEVPIRFETRQHGESKLTLSDAIGAFKVIHRLAWKK